MKQAAVRHGAEDGSSPPSSGVSFSDTRGHRDNCVVVSLTPLSSAQGTPPRGLSYVGTHGVPANDPDARASACGVFVAALESASVSREMAGAAMGVSRTRVDLKCSPIATNAPPTLADVLALIDAGGRPLDAAQSVVDALQSRIDDERGRSALSIESLGPLSMGMVAAMGSLCDGIGAALARRSVSPVDAADLRRRCVVVCRQVGALSALFARIQ